MSMRHDNHRYNNMVFLHTIYMKKENEYCFK